MLTIITPSAFHSCVLSAMSGVNPALVITVISSSWTPLAHAALTAVPLVPVAALPSEKYPGE